MLIGAVMKNQQGQYQLNLMSINIFKEMFGFFWYGLLEFKGLSRLKKLQNITESYLPRLREQYIYSYILPLLELHGTFCLMN